MDDIQDWLRDMNIEMWQRRIRQLRQELRDEKNQQRSPSPEEVSSPTELGGRSRTTRSPRKDEFK